MIVRRGSKR